MRNGIRITVVSILCLAPIICTPRPGFSQAATTIVAGTVMGGLIDDLKKSILEIIERTDQSVSSATFLTRMQMQILLTELENQANSVVGKTFGEIDETQQKFFINARQTIAELQDMGNSILDNTDQVLQRTEFAISAVPFTSQEPRLRSHEPRVLRRTGGTGSDPIVTFDGSWLANGNPTLSIAGEECKIIDLKEPRVQFSCPSKLFSGDPSEMIRLTGEFQAVEELSWGEWIKSFFSKPKIKAYPVSIAVVPETIGNADVSVTRLVESREESPRTHPYDTGARHCTWGSETLVNITPAPGWMIDQSSVRVVAESSNGGNREVRNLTNAGFQVYARGLNSGNCVSAFGQTISKDARGWDNGKIFWTEYRMVDKSETFPAFSGALRWGDSRVVELPDRTTGFLIKLNVFDGTIREYNGPSVDNIITIEQDGGNRSLMLRPSRLETAFR